MNPIRAAIAALPALAVLGLAASGAAEWTPALLTAALCAACAAVLLMDTRHGATATAAEATRLARALEGERAAAAALIRAEHAVLDRLPYPVLLLDAGRVVRRANASAARLGVGHGALLRQPGLRAAIDRALADGLPQAAEIGLPVPTRRQMHADIIPLDPPLGDGSRVMAVLADRTREHAVERMRADFVANASHELRTPLASLIGFIDTLRGPAADDPPAQARFLAIMGEQAQRMNRLIDDLLSLSRIELTEHQPPADRVALPTLVRRVAASFEPLLASRRTRLALDLPEATPSIAGDADQLEQVLHNLLDNAIKYGREDGAVRLAASAETRQGRPGVALAIADDGSGIARVHIPRLTERFYRADKHRSRAVGGTGLGLAIVKHIITRHRGQLGIESAEGAGTTVTVWLPAAPSPLGEETVAADKA